MPDAEQRLKGFLGGFGVCSLWVCEADGFRVRLSLDDFAAAGIDEYQRVRLRIPGGRESGLYLCARNERPPFVWLEFGAEMRRW